MPLMAHCLMSFALQCRRSTPIPVSTSLASVSKLHGSVLRQRVTELAVEVLGDYAMPQQPRLLEHDSLNELIGEPSAHTAVSVSQYFGDRAMTIASGSTEVQKNIIANRVLGL